MRLLLVLLAALTVMPATAAQITTIFSGYGSGSLDGTPFTDVNFTVTLVGDTDTRVFFGNGYYVENSSTIIDIDGLGSLVFTDPTTTFVNNQNQLAGFSQIGSDLYMGDGGAALDTYDLLTSIGPIFINAQLLQWGAGIATSGGNLIFSDSSNIEGSFEAIVGDPVPEPGSLALFGMGAIAVWVIRRRAIS